ncbi:hypothetical protein JCM19301_292 [Jejuia pallidilutea]|uniref:DUF1573 domain-containing protein n=1 Tax=Jejuia pallidilutea TaxID=504487 RepID=A0A090X107_9FLAO|nr:hypothetical protein JCM19301_292 [Jejuia pallidilutea]GAL73407.1 hypothetical protein JCM19302_1209 [Jejuia pallidilutea]GAL89712.1 hypothetical protein JCM19538_2758 [Jejuia pallidilutea]
MSKSDSLVEVSHIIKNIGEHDLFLSELKTSCGCTGVNIDKNAIKPGDSTFVRLDIDLKDKYGPLGIYTKFVANTKEGYHSLFIKMIIK